MSNYNKVSGAVSDADSQKIMTAIEGISASLPFLINLNVEERKNARKMGAKSIEYVNLNLQGALTYPKVLKVGFDVAEFKKDVTLYNALQPLAVKLQALSEAINDTMMGVGSDAMMAADEVYAELKSSAKKDANVKELVKQISARYSAQSKPRVSSKKSV